MKKIVIKEKEECIDILSMLEEFKKETREKRIDKVLGEKKKPQK